MSTSTSTDYWKAAVVLEQLKKDLMEDFLPGQAFNNKCDLFWTRCLPDFYLLCFKILYIFSYLNFFSCLTFYFLWKNISNCFTSSGNFQKQYWQTITVIISGMKINI